MTPEEVNAKIEAIGCDMRDGVAGVCVSLTRLEASVRALSEQVKDTNARADRMADRLIQMAMVNRGAFREAVSSGRVAQLDPAKEQGPSTEDDDLWREEEWPPKGHVGMSLP
jgi:hypothetical protein